MNTKFKIDGCYEVEITSDGHIRSENGGAYSKGDVGIHVNYTPLAIASDAPETRTVVAFFVKRNQARAIASAMLSAVSEANG